MRKEPFVYGECYCVYLTELICSGMRHNELEDDPQLGNKRNELIVQAARQLSAAQMIRFDELSNSFVISDLGRIAAKYYLRYQSIEVFSESLASVSAARLTMCRHHVQPQDEERRPLRHALTSDRGESDNNMRYSARASLTKSKFARTKYLSSPRSWRVTSTAHWRSR